MLRDNTLGGSCGKVFLKTQSQVELWTRFRFLKGNNPVDTFIKVLSKRIDLNLVKKMEFDELPLLKFQFPLTCQPYRLDKSIWKHFIPVFCTWNWNNHHILHLWIFGNYLCFCVFHGYGGSLLRSFNHTTLQFKSILNSHPHDGGASNVTSQSKCQNGRLSYH